MTFEIEGFTPLGVIGRGGFGTVHRAADDAHGREVAVKILARINDDSARRRFDRERRAMGILSGHPTIGIVYTSGFTANQEPYIVMEMIRGGSLADRLAREGPLPAADVVELGATLAEALHHAHEGGVLHLDLKPENILISRFGLPKIVDFGIAALVDDESVTSTIRATPSYADPQVLDGKPGTEQSDVYGLAATLFTLLDGSPPYSGEPSGLYRVMQRVALDPVPRIERSDVSPQLADLLHRAMAKDSADRPESMDEFAHLLLEVDAEPVTRRRAKHRRVDRSSSDSPPVPDPAGPDEHSGPVDDWPGEGERPRLPGAVDHSNPVRTPDPTPPHQSPVVSSQPLTPQTFVERPPSGPLPPSPDGSSISTPASPVRPVPSQAWASAGPPAGGPPPSSYSIAPVSPSSSGDWPQRGVLPSVTSEQSSSHRNNMRAVAVLATLAVILAAVLAFVVIRRGDRGGSADSGNASTENGSTENGSTESRTAIDVVALATDDGSLPDVVGLRTVDARAVLDASGFGVEIPSHCFDTVESQVPESGAAADASTVVSLQYAPCVVPDFVGLRLPEAERIVEEEFVVGLLITWPSHCDDLVVDQSVTSGSVVEPGTEVELTLSDDCSS